LTFQSAGTCIKEIDPGMGSEDVMTASVVMADAVGWGHMGGWGWGMAVFGWLFMSLLVGVVAWVAWSTARRPEPHQPGEGRAREVLDERYARGELDRDEYLERRADLTR
jgi:putative membrane protein